MSEQTKYYPPTQERVDVLIDMYLSLFELTESKKQKSRKMIVRHLNELESMGERENAIDRLILDEIGEQAAEFALEGAK